jgi:mono/diheme cytochrome c family protein
MAHGHVQARGMNARTLLATALACAVLTTFVASAVIAAVGEPDRLPATPATAPALAASDPASPLPARLAETGLFVPGSVEAIAAGSLPFAPQYPLWSDGAAKRRWLYLPPGASIDASRPDAWEFPPGTRAWKEFRHGRRVETRFIERLADGSWRYATYLWNADGSDATLAPADGIADVAVPDAPGGRYALPSRGDCVACHEGAPVPLLGVSALQLSNDRDPLAPHAEPVRPEHQDLAALASRGLVRNLPASQLERPPRIDAPTPTGRAALGYLHANCGHCHNAGGAVAGIDLVLAHETADPAASLATVMASLTGASRYRTHAGRGSQRLVPGRAADSVIAVRMRSRSPLSRMPPLGVEIVDDAGLALVERWIRTDLNPDTETSP